jgi:DNA-binding response OmpR family regulator
MMTTTALFLVEDDALLRDLLEASFDADAARFRAVITDIRLGAGPDGWAVARRARELVPTMPVVYMSGDSSHEWSSKGVPNSLMVAKPFAPAQIITAVSTLLNAADTH